MKKEEESKNSTDLKMVNQNLSWQAKDMLGWHPRLLCMARRK